MTRTTQRIIAAILIGGLVVLVVGFFLWMSPWIAVRQIMTSAYRDLLGASVPHRVAFAILALGGAPFILALMRLNSKKAPFLDELWPPKKSQAFVVVCAYAGGFSLLMFFLMRDQHFAPGEARFICSRDYAIYEHGGRCPRHGIDLAAITADDVGLLESIKKNGPPRIVEVAATGPFFDTEHGRRPLVYFSEDEEGRLVTYNGDGFDQLRGERLKPATPVLIGRLRRQLGNDQLARDQAEAKRQHRIEAEQRRAKLLQRAQRIQETIARDPDNGDLYLELGRVLERSGQRSEALRAYKRALFMLPTSQEARGAIARMES